MSFFTSLQRQQLLLFVSWMLLLATKGTGSDDSRTRTCDWDTSDPSCSNDDFVGRTPPDNCRIVLAPSELGGHGVFTLKDLHRGQAVLPGDVVIHVVDYNATADDLQQSIRDYWWSAEETGGMYEGVRVAAHAPGIGMVANGVYEHSNLLPHVPRVDEAGLTRTEYPGSGAITHYHNWSFYVQADTLTAGSELLVNYGPNWFQERKDNLVGSPPPPRSVEWLRANSWCLDNIRPITPSRYQHAGRGLLARRSMPMGAVVAPVPLLAVKRNSLTIQRERLDGTIFTTEQLLLNYCFGHERSSTLLYSYGPMVNLINHAGGKIANVKLRWVREPDPSKDPFSQTFMMELVALRDIERGDEILLDYGSYWVDAWVSHLQQWNPTQGADTYTPSYVMDDAIKVLRTEQELKNAPYPSNVFTSCYYRYSDNKGEAERLDDADESSVTVFRWKQTRGIFQPQHLRPCKVMERDETDTTLEFKVQIMNRPGLASIERIPKGRVHIVSHVPRNAITFSDRTYTTDQHLENAFRYPISLGSLFPEAWKDL